MFWSHRSRFGHRSSITCLFVVNTACSEFAPRQKRMFWGHTLKERGIVIFAWSQCFVCFEGPSCFRHTHTCIRSVLCILFSLFALNECNFRIDKSSVRIVHRTNRQPSCEHEVVKEMQFSDRQLHLTGRLSFLIRTGCTTAFSDRVS